MRNLPLGATVIGCCAALASCVGNDIADNPAEIADLVVQTNFNLEAWVDGEGMVNRGAIVSRWDDRCEVRDPQDTCGPIPVQTHNDPQVISALDAIEGVVGRTLFDKVSIATAADDDISRGLLISYGTATNMPGNTTCGEVTRTNSPLGSAALPSGVWTGTLTIHLGAEGCGYEMSTLIHEFGHALGMAHHFDGFGDGDAWNANSWNTLYAIYNSPIGSGRDGINAARVR